MHLVAPGREDLPQGLFEPDLPQAAPELGHAEERLELRHLLADALHLSGRLGHGTQLLPKVGQRPRLDRAPLGEAARHVLLRLDQRVEPGAELDQLLLEGAGAPAPPQEEDDGEQQRDRGEQGNGRGGHRLPNYPPGPPAESGAVRPARPDGEPGASRRPRLS